MRWNGELATSLLLFANALPIKRKIIQKAGPGMVVKTLLRVGGGVLYALLLHALFSATGWAVLAGGPGLELDLHDARLD